MAPFAMFLILLKKALNELSWIRKVSTYHEEVVEY
jgi:hypothetical protein